MSQSRTRVFERVMMRPSAGRATRWVTIAAAGTSVIVGRLIAASATSAAVVVAAIIGILLALLCAKWPRGALVAVLLSLPFLAALRRLVAPSSSGLDPIIAMPLVAACLLFLAALTKQGISSSLSRLMALYGLFLGLALFNPASGSLAAAAVGTGLSLTAVLWFFVGRGLLDYDASRWLARGYIVVSVIVAIYGLRQQFFGFSGAEKAYIASRIQTYAALDIYGFTRPFSTLSSGSEYGHVCALGAVACLAFIRRRWLKIALLALLLTAVFFSATRIIIVVTVCGLVVGISQAIGISTKRAGLIAAAALALLFVLLQAVAPTDTGYGTYTTYSSAAVGRSVVGLTHPFDPRESTAGLHIAGILDALNQGLRNPLGLGAAVSTDASSVGQGVLPGETDVTGRLLALGYVGIIFYFALLGRLWKQEKFARLQRVGRWSTLGLIVMFNSWFETNEYSVSALLWCIVGARDRAVQEPRRIIESSNA